MDGMDKNRPPLPGLLLAGLMLVAIALPACDRERQPRAGTDGAAAEMPLPRPDADAGSVTGMPDEPGPGAIGPPPAPETGLVLVPDMPLEPGAIEPPPGEPTAVEAVAVVHDYYAAIAAREYARAHALWAGGGEASGQTLEQFSAGFAGTTSVVAEAGTPGRVEPAAGSRYVEVPVSVTATRDDGSVHRYIGSYTLRRAVVDGASDEQRAWRIASADIREVR